MRFVTHESEGRLTTGDTVGRAGTTKQAGITVTVHDSLYLYKTVGLFRSEEESEQGGRGQAVPHLERRLLVRRKARALCERLNEKAG